MNIVQDRRLLTIDRDTREGGSPVADVRAAQEAADERLRWAATRGGPVEVVVALRGQILPPLRGRGRWRIRTVNGQTTFIAASVVAVTPLKNAR